MFRTRKVIAETFSIVGGIRQQCTLNLLFGGSSLKGSANFAVGPQVRWCRRFEKGCCLLGNHNARSHSVAGGDTRQNGTDRNSQVIHAIDSQLAIDNWDAVGSRRCRMARRSASLTRAVSTESGDMGSIL